jgi:hypothetical protein
MLNQDCISLDIEESSLSSSEDTNARSTPTREDIIGIIDTPSPLSLGQSLQQHQQNLNANSQRNFPSPLPTPPPPTTVSSTTTTPTTTTTTTTTSSHPHQLQSSSPPGRQNPPPVNLNCQSRRQSGSSGDLLGLSSSNVSANNVHASSNNNGHSSKASLASPEDINLEENLDVVLSTYGTYGTSV